MAARNVREGATSTGITPQVHGDVLADKLNRESAAEIAALKKKLEPVKPGPDQAPTDAPRFYLRAAGVGWPFVTADLTVPGGSSQPIPGSGMDLGLLYTGEMVIVDLFVWGITSATGPTWSLTELRGRAGQGSPYGVVETRKPYMPGPTGLPHPWFVTASFTIGRPLLAASIRFQLGADGGSVSVTNGSALWQKYQIYTPLLTAKEEAK